MKIHVLKLEQPFFDDVYNNQKEFEVRKNDRDFKLGDRIKFVEYPHQQFSKFVIKDVKYILEGGQHGIDKDYVVLGLKEISFGLSASFEPRTIIQNIEHNPNSKSKF